MHMWIYADIAVIVMLALATIVRRPRFVPADPADTFAETEAKVFNANAGGMRRDMS